MLVISIILFFICYSLISFGTSLSDSLNNRGLDIIFKVLAIVIAAAVVFLLYFAFPIVVLYDNSAFKSIQLSVRLVWRDMRRVVFIVVFIFLLYMLINMLFVGLINSKDAIAINIIVFIITLLFMPITIAVMPLILLHDAELRYGAEVRNL
ncbi:MAG: hypothetical protein HWD59_07540 [Coxiellaceae bacterium]|nr:MAG: hypothetical protein HWD59_07540 [Coxiellaceae bacterium]